MSDIEEVLNEAGELSLPEGKFEGEVFLSTDGKNTVHVKSNTREGRKAGLEWAKEVYERLRVAYGTKQQLNVQTYDPKEDLGKCPKCGADNARSKTTGKIYCSAKCWLKEGER
jgi:hypothetical protein